MIREEKDESFYNCPVTLTLRFGQASGQLTSHQVYLQEGKKQISPHARCLAWLQWCIPEYLLSFSSASHLMCLVPFGTL